MVARARGQAPTDHGSARRRGPVRPQHGKRPKKNGGPSPFLVVGVALAAGVALARVIDWRGHAHPRRLSARAWAPAARKSPSTQRARSARDGAREPGAQEQGRAPRARRRPRRRRGAVRALCLGFGLAPVPSPWRSSLPTWAALLIVFGVLLPHHPCARPRGANDQEGHAARSRAGRRRSQADHGGDEAQWPHSANRNTEEVRRDIAAEREQLADAVEDLRAGIGEATDVSARLRERLPVVAAGAFATGFVVAGGIGATMRLFFRREARRQQARMALFVRRRR